MDYYEINVSKDGRHFFATAPRSLRTPWGTKEALEVFKAKFPESEGYEVTVTAWETRGRGVDFDNE